jgi:hypothetical protein
MIAQTAPAPPPAVLRSEDSPKLLATFPSVVDGGKRFVIMGLTVTGIQPLLEALKAKLRTEGWPSNFVRLQSGETALSIGTEHKTLEQALALAKRFSAGEFGAVKAQPLAIPDPSQAN